MILADTSVWITHLDKGVPRFFEFLQRRLILMHTMVAGELALGNMKDRQLLLQSFVELPQAMRASDEEVLSFVEANKIYGSGIGFVDSHLLAAASLSKSTLWTFDKRLDRIARQFGLGPKD